MTGHLDKLCARKRIKLQYINDRVLGRPGGNRIITVHSVFKSCPYKVAEAVVEYFISPKKSKDNMRIIIEFLQEICYPEANEKKELVILPEAEEKIGITPDESNEAYEEANITNMDIRSVYRDKEYNYESDVIKLDGNNVLEIKVVVEPPST